MKPPFLVLTLVALVGTIAFRPTGAAAAPDHVATLDRAIALVDQAASGPTTQRWPTARRALDALESDPSLGGDPWLTDPLAATPPDLATAKARLTAARAALATSPTAPAADARGALDQVLADRRFHPGSILDLLPSWLLPVALLVASIVRFVWSIVRWPYDRLLAALAAVLGSRAFALLLALLAGGVVVGVVWLYRRGLRAAIVAQAETRRAASVLPPTPAEALALARERARESDFRVACHYALVAALLAVEARDGIRFDRAATNREHLRRLAARGEDHGGEVGRRLTEIVERFDRAWYGQDEVTRADFETIAALVERLAAVAA